MNENLVKILKDGGTAVIPTDTVYGLVCNANIDSAVKKIFDIKKREYTKPMIILASDIEMLYSCVSELSDLEKEIIKKYFPGPLTIIFKKSDLVSNGVTGGRDEIGIRIPDNKELQELIKNVGFPIVASSANIASFDTITNISLLEDSIKEEVDYIYDGGNIYNDPSTIIKIINEKISIIRDGELADTIRKDYKDKII